MLALWLGLAPAALSEFTNIENMVLIRLSSLMVENGGFLRALEAFNGEDGDSDDAVEAFYQQLQTRSPAIFVTCGTSTDEGKSTRASDFLERINVELLVVSAHQRSATAQARGDAEAGDVTDGRDPGVYHMMKAARRLLIGRPLAVEGAGVLRPAGQVPLVHRKGLCIRRMIFTVSFHDEQNLQEVEGDDFDAITTIAGLDGAGLVGSAGGVVETS